MTVVIRAVVVDDEPPARRKLLRLLRDTEGVEVVGEAASAPDAVNLIDETRPDLVLLDVQMPGVDGFGVVAALEVDPLPRVIFVTAHDRYAVRAFEMHALDYLLKPVSPVRFHAALLRARAAIEAGMHAEQALRAAAADAGGGRPLGRILVRAANKAVFLKMEDVDWIGADRNYLDLHSNGRTHTVRGTLRGLEGRLDLERFVRINKSQIVNLDRVREVLPWSHGESVLVMADGTRLTTSRRFRATLAPIFEPRI